MAPVLICRIEALPEFGFACLFGGIGLAVGLQGTCEIAGHFTDRLAGAVLFRLALGRIPV